MKTGEIEKNAQTEHFGRLHVHNGVKLVFVSAPVFLCFATVS